MGQLDPYALAICAGVFGAVFAGLVSAGIQQRRIDRRDLRITELSAELATERVHADVVMAQNEFYAEQRLKLELGRIRPRVNGRFAKVE